MIRFFFALLLALVLFLDLAFAERAPTHSAYKVGVILGLTGPASTWSKNSLRALELARDEINEAGGVNNRKIELLVEDSKTEPSRAVAAYQKLVNVDGVRVIVGDVWAHLINPLLPLAERDRVVLISPTVSDDSPDLRGNYFFTMGHRVESVRDAVALFFKSHPSVSRAGILCYDNSWGHAYSRMWRAVAAEHGVEVVGEVCSFSFGDEQRVALTKFRQKKVDVVIAAEWTDQVMRTMREQGLQSLLLGTANVTEALYVRNAHNGAMDGAYFTDWRPNPSYRNRFFNRFGEEPILESQNSYEILRSIAKALALPNGDLVESLREVRYAGVDGLIDFSKGNFVNQSVGGLYQVERGNVVSRN